MVLQARKINILGTDWTIRYGTEETFPGLKGNDGYTDSSVHDIIIDDMSYSEGDTSRKKDIDTYIKQVLRHEIIHAFLAESGLDGNGTAVDHWEHNEEMVDWFAIQSPKIYKIFAELDLL